MSQPFMFKRTYILFCFFMLTIFQLWSNPILESDALQLATNFHQWRASTKLRSADALTLVWKGKSTGLRSSAVDPAFYIYNIGDNQGFVIVSGEDATKTILGYADEGSFRTENMPENVQYWLDFYQKEIEAVRSAAMTSSTEASAEVSTIAAGTTTVAPLLGGLKWNQTDPYNLLCPWDYSTSTHTLAGCVAVAMSQILKYHQWPNTGTGIHSYLDPSYGMQSVDFSKTSYDWDNMLGSYSSSSTTAQKTAVSTLIYQCGVAVDMDYSTIGSASDISKAAKAFVNHFGYDSEIQQYDRYYYTESEWGNLIKNELNNARPVYYSANSDEGGHAFVCDGYDDNNFFHINWGWGGSFNGYFELSSLSTNHPGVTGATPEFCYHQSLLAGIRRADAINKVTNQIVLYNNGLSSNKNRVSNIANNSTSNSFILSYSFINIGVNTVSVRWGLGFTKVGSTTLTKLTEKSSTPTSIASESGYSAQSFTLSNPTGMTTAGKYWVYPIYLPKDSTTWSIMRGTNVLNNCMIVTVASDKSATIVPALDSPDLILTEAPVFLNKLYQNKTPNIDVTIQNKGREYFSRVGLFLVNATDPDDRTYICESKIMVPAGETSTFHLTGTITCAPGSYYLQAQFDSTNSNSTMNYKTFGPTSFNNILTVVGPPPGPAVLHLNNVIVMTNGIQVSQTDTINLTASISNSGGYFDSRILAFVFPKGGGHSITYLNPEYVYLDSMETKEVTLTGIPNLDPGEYEFSIYSYQDNAWNQLTPGSMATINFTVTEGISSIRRASASTYIHQQGDCLWIESDAPLEQTKLFDLFGRLVRKGSTEKEIPLSGLAQGVYLLQIQINGKTIHERFLKQ